MGRFITGAAAAGCFDRQTSIRGCNKPAAPLEVPAVVTRRKPAPKKAEVPPTSAIVTIRKRGSDRVPDMTPEEHKRRGNAAEAIFREMKRRIAATKER